MAKQPRSSHDDQTQKMGFFLLLRRWFFAGLLVSTPVFLTLYITWILITFIDSYAVQLVPARLNPSIGDFQIPGVGIIFGVILIMLIGALTTGLIGTTLLRFGEALLNRLPVVRSVYGGTKQVVETIMSSRSDTFREVVLIEYPRKNIWVIGFITGATRGEVQNRSAENLVNVFVPTTPNPTSGFLLFYPREEMITLDMEVEEAVKMVVSAGIITPEDKVKNRRAVALKKGLGKSPKKKSAKKKAAKKKRKA